MPAVTGSWIGPDYHTRSLRVYTKKDICTEGLYSHSGAKTAKRCHLAILKPQNDRMQIQNAYGVTFCKALELVILLIIHCYCLVVALINQPNDL